MSKLVSLMKKIGIIERSSADEEARQFYQSDKSNLEIASPPETFFVLPRIALIPFPSQELSEVISSYFNTQVSTKFMVWNLSEYIHPTPIFTGQCIDFIFVGYPNPPLSVFFAIFNSVQKWLESDPNNFALLHCQATKGRSYMVLACYLAWIQDVNSVVEGFNKICRITGKNVELLPSQTRYMQYMQEIIHGNVPKMRRIKIQKVILDGIPEIEQEGSAVRPYLQIFKGTEMVFTTISKDLPPVSYFPSDISICFDVNLEIEGDVLIRCRHLGKDNKPLTIFRMMFNTAFTADLVVRFTKNDLDGAFNDQRFSDEFTTDVFLAENIETDDCELKNVIIKYAPEEVKEEAKEEPKKPEKKAGGESDEELDAYFQSLENK